MKRISLISIIVFLTAAMSSCVHEDDFFDNNSRGNFEALWQIMDEGYCFFDYKDVDWNEVKTLYSEQITENMSDDELFKVLTNMLGELKDGHVNIYSDFNTARYWKWFEDYPDNFDEKIQRNYLGTGMEYSLIPGLKYTVLDGNIGYVYYGSFSNQISDNQWEQVLIRMRKCDGMILDIRNNGGGYLSMADKLAQSFATQKTLCGYTQYKKGKGHNDFSELKEYNIEPSDDKLQYRKKVVLLTNRSCFSAANIFTCFMHEMPNVTIIGDRTGGGSGVPFSSELPNGWSVRFSSNPFFDVNKQQMEFGIEPDIKVDMSNADIAKGKDTIIDTAIEYLKTH